MASDKMSDADQMEMLMALQKEMAKMKRSHEESTRKSEEEMRNLKGENEEMKRLVDQQFGRPTNVVERSFATNDGPKAFEGPKDKVYTLEMNGESRPSKSMNTAGTVSASRCHPFTDLIMEAPLLDKWKGFNRDRYDGTTNSDEHMDVYTTHMSLYTTDDVVLY